jgi:hypothetical protein
VALDPAEAVIPINIGVSGASPILLPMFKKSLYYNWRALLI